MHIRDVTPEMARRWRAKHRPSHYPFFREEGKTYRPCCEWCGVIWPCEPAEMGQQLEQAVNHIAELKAELTHTRSLMYLHQTQGKP